MTVPVATPHATEQPAYSLNQLLSFMAAQYASDLYLKPMRPPLIRVQGKLIPLKAEPLKPGDLEKMLLPILNRAQREKFDANLSVDFGYGVPGVARFRANLYMQRGTVGAVFRRIPIQILTIDQLELPDAIKDLTAIPDGLVLVTGPTRPGQPPTRAALTPTTPRRPSTASSTPSRPTSTSRSARSSPSCCAASSPSSS